MSAAEIARQQRRASLDIERRMEEEKEEEDKKMKLLLLGAGDSGKSTLFKQMRLLYGAGFSVEDRTRMTPIVYATVIGTLKALIEHCDRLGHGRSVRARRAFEHVRRRVPKDAIIDYELGCLIRELWFDPGIQRTWDARACLFEEDMDSVAYYFEKIDIIMSPDYAADTEDILLARQRTTCIQTAAYTIGGIPFEIFDVGGQRSERHKWIHCFSHVTCVIFVASASEYDQMLYEDRSVARIEESLRLFEETVNSEHFVESAVILFLNKKDLLLRKIEKVSIKDCLNGRFADFPIPGCAPALKSGKSQMPYYEAAQRYFLNLFLQRVRDPEKSKYYHFTCATDTDHVRLVFNACKEVIMQHNLIASGFLE